LALRLPWLHNSRRFARPGVDGWESIEPPKGGTLTSQHLSQTSSVHKSPKSRTVALSSAIETTSFTNVYQEHALKSHSFTLLNTGQFRRPGHRSDHHILVDGRVATGLPCNGAMRWTLSDNCSNCLFCAPVAKTNRHQCGPSEPGLSACTKEADLWFIICECKCSGNTYFLATYYDILRDPIGSRFDLSLRVQDFSVGLSPDSF